ncbi:ATP-dependent Clp protease ATP-binding subunit ClpA-like protein CD4A chloroplastic [Bienertia sinuspersici]
MVVGVGLNLGLRLGLDQSDRVGLCRGGGVGLSHDGWVWVMVLGGHGFGTWWYMGMDLGRGGLWVVEMAETVVGGGGEIVIVLSFAKKSDDLYKAAIKIHSGKGVSGLSRTHETAQESRLGFSWNGITWWFNSDASYYNILTWGTCVLIGKCNLENSIAIDEADTKGFDLRGSGMSVDIWTSYAARIMALCIALSCRPIATSSQFEFRKTLGSVITLYMCLLVAATKYRGELEERLKKLMEEIKQIDEIILFIDEVHTLIGARAAKGANAANILKPALARGDLQHIEKDPALERRFQPVQVPEPSVDETIQILRGLREQYEIHRKLRYTDEALEASAQLSYQYISDHFLPDKAIYLIDEAGSRLPKEARELEKELRRLTKEKNEAVCGKDFEKEPLSHLIPAKKVSTDESDRLLKMEDVLHTREVGQDEAIKAISRAIRRARVGLKNPNRPIASFIFSGPTGVCRAVSIKIHGKAHYLQANRFTPGYVGYTEGGQHTEAVRRRQYTVFLFNEIKKAHPDVFNMML